MNDAATPGILIALACITALLLWGFLGLDSKLDECKCHCQEKK